MSASVIALLALMAGASSSQAASPACAPARLSACRTTNQLFGSVDFRTALRRFTGPRQPWLHRRESQYRAAARLIGGPPDAPTRLAPDLIRFSACAAHNCGAKGAMFMGAGGAIRAITLLDLDCAKDCNGLTLVVILRARSPALVAAARQWATDELAKDRRDYPSVVTTPGSDLHVTAVRTIVNHR